MKSFSTSQLPPAIRRSRRGAVKRLACVVPLVAPWFSTSAQDAALAPGNLENVPAPTAQTPAGGAAADSFSPVSWRYHDWRGFVSVVGEARYDDNILQTDRDIVTDFIGVVSPSFSLEYAPVGTDGLALVHLDYRPQFIGYLSHQRYDTVDHAANVNLEETRGSWQLKASHHFTLSTDPRMEQTGYARTQVQNTDLSAGYDLSDKTTISLAPRQEFSSVDNGVAVWEYGAALAVTRHYSAKLDFNLSYYAAEVQAHPGINAFKQSILGGVSWAATGRSQLDLKVGVQAMAYQGGQSSNGNVTPDLMLDWEYQLTGKTTLRLNASYQTYFSQYLTDQVNKTLSFQAVVSHSLTEKIGLELRGGTAFMQQDSVQNSTSNGGDVQFWNVGLGAVYHLGRQSDLRLDYDHQERGGNNLYAPYHRNIAKVSIEHRF
jgi:hypothetical protein